MINKAEGLLARWYKFQPSEMDNLEIEEFVLWVNRANEQIEEQNQQ